jgi:CMP-N,N'-diacetyllegionaminic acid synthase
VKTAALVPVRSGSKGIIGKNTRLFAGRPLFSWAVCIGRDTCDSVYVSSDDITLAEISHMYGAAFIPRPAELATDMTPMLPVVQHALSEIRALGTTPDVIVLLQPTSPWRTERHVRMALRKLEESGADSVVSVVEIPAHYLPDFAFLIEDGNLRPFTQGRQVTRRQDTRKAYSRDGTVYAIRRKAIEGGSLYGKECLPLVIPTHESVNLDTEADWAHAVAATTGKRHVLRD